MPRVRNDPKAVHADPGTDTPRRMNSKQAMFVEEYLKDLNGTRAAIAAGYGAHSAGQVAFQLLNDKYFPEVAAAVRDGYKRKREECRIEARRVVEELAKIGFLNVKQLFDAKGFLLPIHEMPDEVACCVRKIRVTQKMGLDEKGKPLKVKVAEIELWDKLDALKQIAQHLGLLKDQVTINNNMMFNWDAFARELQAEVPDVIEQKIIDALPPPGTIQEGPQTSADADEP